MLVLVFVFGWVWVNAAFCHSEWADKWVTLNSGNSFVRMPVQQCAYLESKLIRTAQFLRQQKSTCLLAQRTRSPRNYISVWFQYGSYRNIDHCDYCVVWITHTALEVTFYAVRERYIFSCVSNYILIVLYFIVIPIVTKKANDSK